VVILALPLTRISRDDVQLCSTQWSDFNRTCHRYSTCEWLPVA